MPKLGGPAVPAAAAIQWADLSTTLGWSTPSTRPNHDDDITSIVNADDFYSLMCNGWGNVNADRDECIKVKGNKAPYPPEIGFRYGATHVRYSCTDKALWVLTYAFAVSNNVPHTQAMCVALALG